MLRDRGATLRLGGGGTISDSILGGGAQGTFSHVEEQENYFSLSLLLCVGPVGSGRR